MTSCGNTQFDLIKDTISDGGFQDTKATFVKTVCQNFTFTSEQVGELLSLFDFSSDKLDAVDLFVTSMIDPTKTGPVADAFDDDDDKSSALEKLSSFTATKARDMLPLRIEDDGHRSGEAMQRLLSMLEDCSMSSDKVKALQEEITAHPSPPFNQQQVCDILDKFSFSSDKEKALAMFVGPQIVYPMTCDQIIAVLDNFSMSSDKIHILPALKPFIYDRQNKLSIVSSFSFSSDKKKAEEILRDLVVDFKPNTPPEAAIQKALQAVGKCPAGYNWRQVMGGWRCAAGGHYVSDAAVKQYFDSNV